MLCEGAPTGQIVCPPVTRICDVRPASELKRRLSFGHFAKPVNVAHSARDLPSALGRLDGWLRGSLDFRIKRVFDHKNMANKKKKIPEKYQIWIDARKRHHLSHVHIQMARELGMNPKKFGKLDNHKQEPWKAPLPDFIEDLYCKRFGREKPDVVKPIEQVVKEQDEKKQKKRKEEKRQFEQTQNEKEDFPVEGA